MQDQSVYIHLVKYKYKKIAYFVGKSRLKLITLFILDHFVPIKKSLKIPKGGNQNYVNQRRTNNTMAKSKSTRQYKQRSTKHTYKTNNLH